MGDSVSGVGGPGGPSGPGGSGGPGLADFKNSLKGKSEEQLRDMIKDPKLTDAQRNAIIEELVARTSAKFKDAMEAGGPDGAEAGAEDDRMKELLKKLKDGTISQAELKELAGILGVDPKDLEKEKGKGEGEGGGGGEDNNI
jgi:Asp-tRNA(Asn)/Glu-tRNA(Gln) amidotransferase B subunit